MIGFHKVFFFYGKGNLFFKRVKSKLVLMSIIRSSSYQLLLLKFWPSKEEQEVPFKISLFVHKKLIIWHDTWNILTPFHFLLQFLSLSFSLSLSSSFFPLLFLSFFSFLTFFSAPSCLFLNFYSIICTFFSFLFSWVFI